MPLFDLNNLEHTTCLHGSGNGVSSPYLIVPVDSPEVMLRNPAINPPQPQVVVAKLTRQDFTVI